MITTVKFAKLRPDAKIPTKRTEDMGLDIYACFDEDYLVIYPSETKIVPTGIMSACDVDYGFLIEERGSTGSIGLARRAGVIDGGFRGEWKIMLTNTTNKPIYISKIPISEIKKKIFFDADSNEPTIHDTIYPYEKAIAQALVIPVPELDIEEWTCEEIKSIPSERGEGMLGSSGK